MNPLLLIDTNYLCHRAFHAMGDLNHDGDGTGAIFGVLRDIVTLQETLASTRCVFAFDYGGKGLRGAAVPTYKASRRERYENENDVEKEQRRNFQDQVKNLRRRYLPFVGFRNVFAAKGFEADDIIASIAAALPGDEEAIIISSDQDLWQCLRGNVWCYNPQTRKAYTADMFRTEWGIDPTQWATVKAFAGCDTDDVIGIPGVGEKTAARWVRGNLPAHHKTYEKISAGLDVHNRNIGLVKLPYPGTPEFTLREDEVTEEAWNELADELGMRSIKGTVPRAAARKSRGRKRGKGKQEGFGFDGS